MMVYKLRVGPESVIVLLDSDQPSAATTLVYEGNEEAVEVARYELENSLGARGHPIGDATTPIDLHAAMNSDDMQDLRPICLLGEDIVKSY